MNAHPHNAYLRTDLAAEWTSDSDPLPLGVTCAETEENGIQITRTHIETEEAAQALGKPQGSYVMLGIGCFWEQGEAQRQAIRARVTEEFCAFQTRLAPHCRTVLAIGLGNREMTADALGPCTVHKLTVTRHLQGETQLFEAIGNLALAALAPGVIGQTGIETFAQILGCVQHVRPDLVVVVDALAARSADRLATSIQFTDSGLIPGSGVGNHRHALSQETLGVPVLTIGVPTLIDSSTLIADTLEQAGVEELTPALESLLKNNRSFFVTRKDSDLAVAALADLLASVINQALLPALQ